MATPNATRNDTNIAFRSADFFSLVAAFVTASVWSMIRGYVCQQKLSPARRHRLEILSADQPFDAFRALLGRNQVISCATRPQFFEFGIAQENRGSPWRRRPVL